MASKRAARPRRRVVAAAVAMIVLAVTGASSGRAATNQEPVVGAAPVASAPPGMAALAASRSAALQVRALGVDAAAVDVPRHESLSAAVRSLLEQHGGLSGAVERRLAALDSMPEDLRGPIARVVDAFIAFDAAVSRRHTTSELRAPSDGPAARRSSATSLETIVDESIGEIFAARSALLDAAADLASVASTPGFGASPTETAPFQLPPWLSVSVGVNDDAYDQDFVLLIDEGGDDIYTNNAGGSNLHGGACNLAAVLPSPAAALVDLSGNDRYVSGRSCGANGGGAALGAGFLFDGGGDDVYSAGSLGTNGGGDFGGIGMLVDQSGGDTYLAGSNGTNGGGAFGVGFLWDGDGGDSRTAGDLGTNGGAQIGAGALVDLAGSDSYMAGDIGTNGGANGGVAFLIDAQGDDDYTAGSAGVNGGGSGGLALLLDLLGFDEYVDGDGGTGNDKTVAPKGGVGAQLDVGA